MRQAMAASPLPLPNPPDIQVLVRFGQYFILPLTDTGSQRLLEVVPSHCFNEDGSINVNDLDEAIKIIGLPVKTND